MNIIILTFLYAVTSASAESNLRLQSQLTGKTLDFDDVRRIYASLVYIMNGNEIEQTGTYLGMSNTVRTCHNPNLQPHLPMSSYQVGFSNGGILDISGVSIYGSMTQINVIHNEGEIPRAALSLPISSEFVNNAVAYIAGWSKNTFEARIIPSQIQGVIGNLIVAFLDQSCVYGIGHLEPAFYHMRRGDLLIQDNKVIGLLECQGDDTASVLFSMLA